MMRGRGRRSAPREAKPRMLIVCEGKRTEPNYFEGFRREHHNVIISVRESPGKAPAQIVRCAIERADELDIGKVPGDSVWCVFDVDECSDDEMRKAVELADGRLKLAVSNPCFELWFLLHFRYTDKRMDTCREVIGALQRHMPGYDKAGDHYDRLSPMSLTAIKNAERLEKGASGRGHAVHHRDANPCTGVHHLVADIISGGQGPPKGRRKDRSAA
ncbi:MAG TPA: RloB family protein [Methanomassiliicoccales archaeon]|nr:RloB family protein [Methanomassiliicoccales archaeon]